MVLAISPILDTGLYIGITTRQLLNKLENDGAISPSQVMVFYVAVRSFYCTAAKYVKENLPLKDAVLKNACFVDFEQRSTAEFSQVEFFVSR